MSKINLLEYQKTTLEDIVNSFKTKDVLILSDKTGLGKSLIGEQIILENYEKSIFRGKYLTSNEEFGVFKQSFLSDSKIKNEFIKDTIKSGFLLTSGFLKIASIDYSSTLDSIFSKYSRSDLEKIVHSINYAVYTQKCFFVLDELMFFDSSSIIIMNYLLEIINNLPGSQLKLLIIVDNNELLDNPYFKELKKIDVLQFGKITDNDMIRLNLKNKTTDIFLSNKNNKLEVIVVKDIIDSLMNSINKNVQKKIILQTLKLFDEPVQILDLVSSIPEYSFDEIEFCLNILQNDKLIISENTSNKNRVISLHSDISKKLEELTPIYIKENRSDIYLNYLNEFRPQMYFEKFHHYSITKDSENKLISGILAYCYLMRESVILNTKQAAEIQIFIDGNKSKEYIQVLKLAYEYYVSEFYENTYLTLDNFLISPEILAEIVYLKYLSIGRLKKYNEYVSKDSIKEIELSISQVKNINNFELMNRLEEVKLFTYNLINSDHYQNIITTEYFKTLDSYSILARRNPKNKLFWQVRHAILGSRVDLIDIPQDKLILLEQSYEVLEIQKEDFPKQFLRTACNLAGRYFWEAKYQEASDILNIAIDFIESHKLKIHWGIIYHVNLVVKCITNFDFCILLKDSSNLLENKCIEEKMHEPAIYWSNHAVFLALHGEVEAALSEITRRLELKYGNNYNAYLLLTNQQVLTYSVGNHEEAIRIGNKIDSLIKEGIPNFDKVFVLERQKRIKEIILNKEMIENFMESMRPSMDAGSMKNSSDVYFRYLLLSNITYWVN
ncbi:hypothetical protein JZO82_15360 [Vagococcus fluvialis]|uniref:hypothetical protein n=1 Tax=Vagococcus fluvialis TaxID=2738 RepID=UPI001A8FDC4B|nr:hypothetical protein [Vagococcus fluvialis]MBO0430546.1 hypothetical protein [Vagococcus fluvialis]